MVISAHEDKMSLKISMDKYMDTYIDTKMPRDICTEGNT